MSAGHTPGPWFVDFDIWKGGGGLISDGGCFQILDGQDSNKSSVLCTRNPWPERADEMRANARLMASAPDLLAERDRLKAANAELAEALEELLNAHAIPSTGCKERFAHKRAHAALANNKGETE